MRARSDRQARQERRARRQAVETPQPVPTPQKRLERVAPATPPANRGTFRVAKAQRQLAAELPGLVRVKEKHKRQGEAKRSPSAVVEAPMRDTRAAQRSVKTPAPPDRKTPAGLSMDKPDPRLKCRPKDTSPASGGGSGRSFVPWGKC